MFYKTRGEKTFHYFYDANGMLYAVSYKLTGTGEEYVYYYSHNWRGDIVGLYNGNGELRAKYTYDAWGNVTSIIDQNGNAIISKTHVGNLNPFRYRGYYQDTETGFYYLMSRYYDTVTHRFVNADGYFQTGSNILDVNMNIYCRNNPVNCFDPTGTRCKVHSSGYMPTCVNCNFIYREYKEEQERKRKARTFSGTGNTNYVYTAGTTSSGRGVFIVNRKTKKHDNSPYKNLDNIYIMDYRSGGNPDMQIVNSYLIDQKEIQMEVIKMMQEYNRLYPTEPAWYRTDESLLYEWDVHNGFYNFGIGQDHTADTNFDNNDEGKGFLGFVFR